MAINLCMYIFFAVSVLIPLCVAVGDYKSLFVDGTRCCITWMIFQKL